jgi:hypothetical protein
MQGTGYLSEVVLSASRDGLPDGSLWVELRARGWTEDEIRGVRGENFLRAWEGAQARATAPTGATGPSGSASQPATPR